MDLNRNPAFTVMVLSTIVGTDDWQLPSPLNKKLVLVATCSSVGRTILAKYPLWVTGAAVVNTIVADANWLT